MGERVKFGFNVKISEETTQKIKSDINLQTNSDERKFEEMQTTNDLSEDSEIVTEECNIKDKPLNEDKIQEIDEDAKCETMDIDKTKPKEQLNDSEFKSNLENNPQNSNSSENIHYEGTEAIYTDPTTKTQYVWSNEKNEWIIRSNNVSANNGDNQDNTTDESKFGFENNTHTYTDSDGSIYIWDNEKNAWFPKVDDDFLAYYQMSYGFVDNKQPDENAEKSTPQNILPKPKKPEDPKWFEVAEDQNNKVYVSNLPLDITEEEFVDIMQKCGLVMKDPTTHKMKVKLYTKPNSKKLKGDGLCTYIKIESVDLALKILDGYNVRDHRIKVQRAQFQMKGEYNPSLKPKKKRKKDKEKLKKLQERLFDWRPEKMRGEKSKHERIVIIKNLFEPSQFDKEVHLLLEYKEDLREECSKCGEVKKITLYDNHPQGIAQIIMKEPEEAENVIKLINGRWFGKRQLTAEIWDGKTKYKMEETDESLNKRIDGWNKYLDEEEKT